MIMDLVLTAIIKIMFASVDLKIVLVSLLEKDRDGGQLLVENKKIIYYLTYNLFLLHFDGIKIKHKPLLQNLLPFSPGPSLNTWP